MDLERLLRSSKQRGIIYHERGLAYMFFIGGIKIQKTVLVVEDEEKLRHVIALFLRDEGLRVLEADCGEVALEMFHCNTVDLVILDVMLPDMSGFEVCSSLRKVSEVTILFLTALGDDDYFMMGYRSGADDYIAKPFKASILAMKVKRILARQNKADATQTSSEHGVKFEEDAFRCFVDDTDVGLTHKEFQILRMLINNEGRVLTRDYLLNVVWGYEYTGDTRVVDNHIKNIRKKLGAQSSCIKTVISVGYKYEKCL